MPDESAPDDQPVTRREFEPTMEAVKQDFNRLEDAVADVQEIAQRGLRVAEATLTTVQSIDLRLKAMGNHGERLEDYPKEEHKNVASRYNEERSGRAGTDGQRSAVGQK